MGGEVTPSITETINWTIQNGVATLKIGSALSGWKNNGAGADYDWFNNMLCITLNEYTWYEVLIPVNQFFAPTNSCSMTVELQEDDYMGVTFTPIVRQGSNYYQGDSVLPLEDIATGKVLLEFSSGDMPNVNMEMASYVGLHIDNGDTMIGRNEIYIKSITLDFN